MDQDDSFGFGAYKSRQDDERFDLKEKQGKYAYPVREVNVTDNEFYLDQAYKKDLEKIMATIDKPEILGTEFSNHVLLVGLPGAGKTYFAKYVATKANADFIPVKGFPNPLWVGYLFEEVRERAKEKHQIIFLDEADQYGSRDNNADPITVSTLGRLLQEMDSTDSNYNVTIIAATNKADTMDIALRRGGGRIGKEVEFFSLSPNGRYYVLKILAYNLSEEVLKDKNPEKKGHKFKIETALLKSLASITHGYTNGDLKEVLKESFLTAYTDKERYNLTGEDTEESLRIIRPSALKDLPLRTPVKKLSYLAGLDMHIMMIQDYIGKKYTHDSPGKSLMFYGGPGIGKSALAEALADHYKINFLEVNGGQLIEQWLGNTNKNIDRIITRAEQHRPTLLLFDQFEALFQTKGFMGYKDTWTGQFQSRLNYLPKGVIIMATVPNPNLLDEQTVERFERVVPFYLPNQDILSKVWKIYLSSFDEKFNYDQLGEASVGLNGRAVERISKTLQLQTRAKPNQTAVMKLIEYEKRADPNAPRNDLNAYIALGR